ncbi:MAG: hypothetical protein KTR25_00720 [Myxococcales bacterium]|nr:hypothetical protein [Myxococcales bacterium]
MGTHGAGWTDSQCRGACRSSRAWLISPGADVCIFGLPAACALFLVLMEPVWAPTGETSGRWWLVLIVGVDVAHVWSTLYPTYLDPNGRCVWRRWLWLLPLMAWGLGSVIAWWSFALFWRCLAYLAVFHFVRQQAGWVALYQRKELGLALIDRRIDCATIYISMLYPLLWWHAYLPREYDWFISGDFVGGWISLWWVEVLWLVYVGTLAGFIIRQGYLYYRGATPAWGKGLVVISTAACWWTGIIGTNSDWAFTVTNVLIHGIPYLSFIWVLRPQGVWWQPPGVFYGVVVGLAVAEEWLWDTWVWHSMSPGITLGPLPFALLVGLLAVPQITHYLLDGIIWRKGSPMYRWGQPGV